MTAAAKKLGISRRTLH
ncbi:MAG: hypothetical protein DME59_20560 [Verrucomicrobia bacterium]|nr:MAG: hypothetical protein DME59_20560 [Verrucomicrobiota bacterium]